MALVAWLVLVESVDEVVGEEAAGGSTDVWIKQRKINVMQKEINNVPKTEQVVTVLTSQIVLKLTKGFFKYSYCSTVSMKLLEP